MQTLVHLETLTDGSPVQRLQVIALKVRVEAEAEELRHAIMAYRAGGFDAAQASVSNNQGRRLMNEMRALVGEMQTEDSQALTNRSDESHRSALMTTFTDRLGALLGIGMVGLAFVLFKRELAHRQRAGDAIRRLAAIVESSDDAIISKTLDGLIVSWNACARQVYGYDADDVVGRPIEVLCPYERIDEVHENLEREPRLGIHINHFETTLAGEGRSAH